MIEPPSRPKSALDSLIASYSKEKDFKKYREQLAADLFELYNRTVFDNQAIVFSDRLRDTLIHELCHAAAWVISGIKAGHGSVWKR
ncbi:Germ cell nuclear acidic protein [Acropora cervicornis]|uniref:Germ cell nuclear acidic protein n=1 Tax=Acropora cervicornis TaxID=6130 RepID=A0AAD9V6U7_ACRCE|nr:Germ cell nuclear acidic protein [Acropora cervicornis]